MTTPQEWATRLCFALIGAAIGLAGDDRTGWVRLLLLIAMLIMQVRDWPFPKRGEK